MHTPNSFPAGQRSRYPRVNKTSQNISLFPMVGGQLTFSYCLSAWSPQVGSLLPTSLISPSLRIPSLLLRKSFFVNALILSNRKELWQSSLPEDFACTWHSVPISPLMPTSKEVNISILYFKYLHTIGRPKLFIMLSNTMIQESHTNYGRQQNTVERMWFGIRDGFVLTLPLKLWKMLNTYLPFLSDKMCSHGKYLVYDKTSNILSIMIWFLNNFHVIFNPMCSHWLQASNEFHKSSPFHKRAKEKDNQDK